MKPATLQQHLKRSLCLAPDQRILVAVSGGADSVALLHLLRDLAPAMHWHLGVAHMNHGLRGVQSDQDEAFVRGLADSLEVPFHGRRKNVALSARRARVSIEMKAREMRYAFFATVARKGRYDCVALAHTMDDQAETFLLRVMRGAGMAGLGAMEPATERDGLRMVRPLLDVRKDSLIRYLRDRNAAWREDVSNDDVVYLRNRVRHELLPMMRDRFNPRLVETLAQTARLIREDHEVLHALAQTDWADCRVPGKSGALDVARLRALPPARRRRVVLQWLIAAGVDETHVHYETVERVCALCRSSKGTAEASVQEPLRVVREYDQLSLSRATRRPRREPPVRHKLTVPGVTRIPGAGLKVTTRWTNGFKRPAGEKCGRLPAEVYLSGAAVGKAGVYLRYWSEGDRFAPAGMKGGKKVQDIFVDEKVPREQRGRVPLLECRKHIVWIAGYRVARAWSVPSESARSLFVRVERVGASQRSE